MLLRGEEVASVPRVVNDTVIWLSALYFAGETVKIIKLIEDYESDMVIIKALLKTTVNDTDKDRLVRRYYTYQEFIDKLTALIQST